LRLLRSDLHQTSRAVAALWHGSASEFKQPPRNGAEKSQRMMAQSDPPSNGKDVEMPVGLGPWALGTPVSLGFSLQELVQKANFCVWRQPEGCQFESCLVRQMFLTSEFSLSLWLTERQRLVASMGQTDRKRANSNPETSPAEPFGAPRLGRSSPFLRRGMRRRLTATLQLLVKSGPIRVTHSRARFRLTNRTSCPFRAALPLLHFKGRYRPGSSARRITTILRRPAR
jgi:hypothetical protein